MSDKRARRCHLANTIERSVCGGDATLGQITYFGCSLFRGWLNVLFRLTTVTFVVVYRAGENDHIALIVTATQTGERSIAMSVSVCVSACLSVHDHIFGTTRPIFTDICVHVTYGRGSVLAWRRSDMLRISGFVNDVIFAIFAHKLIGCSPLPPG